MKKLVSTSILFFLILSVSCAIADSDNLTNPADNSQIKIFVHDIGNNPVKGATIVLTLNSSEVSNSNEIPKKHIYLFTDSSGKSIVQLTPGTYDFFIQERDYYNKTKTITIFNGSPRIIEFTLDPGYDIWVFFLPVFLGFLLYVCWLCGSSEKMKLVFILFLPSIFIPFLFLMSPKSNQMFFYVALFFSIFLMITFFLLYFYSCKKLPFVQKWEDCSNIIPKIFGLTKAFLTILTVLSWPLIACFFSCEGIEYVFISDLSGLSFPSFIVIGVTIGVLSYLMLTIKQMFVQLLPAHKKKNIVWECTRRIIVAPYIAIAGVYLIFYIGVPGIMDDITPNVHFVFLFSIFAGVFTSTIEEWIYNKVRDILALNKNEINENSKYEIRNSDFVVKLGMNEDLCYRLYYEAKMATVQDLASSNAKSISDKLKTRYSEIEIQHYVDLARRKLAEVAAKGILADESGKSKPVDSQKTNVSELVY